MNTIKIIIILLANFNLFASELACSLNETNVIYINGVNISNIEDNKKSKESISKAFQETKNSLDKNGKVNYFGVWNQSRTLLNDIEELKAQLATAYTGIKRDEYWKMLAKKSINLDLTDSASTSLVKSKFDKAIEQATSKKSISYVRNTDGTITTNQTQYSGMDAYRDLSFYNFKLAQFASLAFSDNSVIEELKINIRNTFKKGTNKVIVVSHSQGNAVVTNAVKELKADPTFIQNADDLKKFNTLIGYMQVAPPTPLLVNQGFDINNPTSPLYPPPLRNRYMLLDNDLIIKGGPILTNIQSVPFNYDSENLKLPQNVIDDYLDKILSGNFQSIGSYTRGILSKSGGAFFHGMDDIYLSNSYKAKRMGYPGDSKTLLEHFKDNMREIASQLESNCSGLNVNLSMDSSFIKDEAKSSALNFTYDYNNPTYPTNEAIFNVSDLGDFGSDTVFKIYQNGALVESKIGKIKLPSPGSFSTYFTAYNPKTLGSGTYTVTVNVTENLPPKMIGGWKAACQGGGIYSGNIANGNLLWFYADFQDDSPNDFNIVDSDGSGRGFSQNLLYTSATSYVTRIEFNNQENEEFTLTDTNGASIKIRTPTNPCVAGEPMPTYD